MLRKYCFRCQRKRLTKNFYHNHAIKDGFTYYCKSCEQEVNKIGLLNPKRPAKHKLWQKIYYQNHKSEYLARSKIFYKKVRKIVFEHYGNKCTCCGESHQEFLSIDHIHGGGRRHSESGVKLYAKIIKRHFPENLQLLCYNCNCSKGFFGYCPHTGEKT